MEQNAPSAVAATAGAPAIAALRAFILAARAGDPLAPVTVVVPSNYAGLSLRRRLGTEYGLVNVRFLVLSRVAELLAAARFVLDRRPLTPWTRAEAIHAALESHGQPFGPAGAHPGAARALDSSIRDLSLASPAALARLAARSQRAKDVVAVYSRFRELTAGHFDAEDLHAAAALAVEERSPALRDLGRVVLYLPVSLTPGELRLVTSLSAAGLLDLVFGLTGDPDADDAVRALASSLHAPIPPAPATPPLGTHIIDAVDTSQEVRSVVRSALDLAAAGMPFHRMAILFPSGRSTLDAITEELRAAGIPFHGPGGRSLAASMPARVLLGAVALPELRFRRAAVMDWLASGPMLDPSTAGRAPAASWDEISRDAGITAGSRREPAGAHWRQRLEAFAANPREERRAPRARALSAFIARLVQDLDPPPAAAAAPLAAWARRLLRQYLGSDADARHWGDDAAAESYAALHEILLQAEEAPPLAAAAPIRALRTAPGRRQYLAAILEQALAAGAGRLGPFGDGVYLGAIQSARGMDFDHVFVVGMVEGVLPAAATEDPLLPDAEREDAGVVTRRARATDARRDYLLALASAPVRTLSFARSDLGAQARQSPSHWLTESAASLSGDTASADSLSRSRGQPWLTVATSFEASLRDPGPSTLSALDWELGAALAAGGAIPPFLQSPALLRASASAAATLPQFARRHAEPPGLLSPWAGRAGARSADASARVFSPTSFETLASCPFRYFLGNVLRVKETRDPEDTNSVSPLDRGAIVHDALERFFQAADAAGAIPSPAARWDASARAALRDLASEICDRYEAAGLTGGAALWHVEKERILRDLAGFLADDDDRRAESGARFLHAELSFGMAPQPGEDPAAAHPPVTVTLAGGEILSFRGKIDRVDVLPGGGLVVYDYKTGRTSQYRDIGTSEDPLSAGQRLQLPVYGLAARAAFAADAVSAYYWAVSQEGAYQAFGYPVDDAVLARLADVLEVLSGLVRDGLFPQVPGKPRQSSYQHCRGCPYDRVCPAASRADAWVERKSAAGLARFVALSEVADASDTDPEAADD